jgi:hypothetical protein
MTIQPIVEGHGEVAAFPILLRRLQDAAAVYDFGIGHPIRRKRSELVIETKLRTAIQLAKGTPDCIGILILLDADDDAACTKGPQLLRWARAEAGEIPCEVVLANREYEAWFLASMESLRRRCGIPGTATSHATPENVRDAKGAVQAQMVPGAAYSPTAHQPSLTAAMDLAQAHLACQSFQKLVRAFSAFCISAGIALPAEWPPPDWVIEN